MNTMYVGTYKSNIMPQPILYHYFASRSPATSPILDGACSQHDGGQLFSSASHQQPSAGRDKRGITSLVPR